MLLFNQGGVAGSNDWDQIHGSMVRSIQAVHFPIGSGSLTLRRKEALGSGQWSRNGVNFLKASFFANMVRQEGWAPEDRVSLEHLNRPVGVTLYPSMQHYDEPVRTKFGAFDFVTTGATGLKVAIEWETGNISSSHRSINKLTLAIGTKQIHAGIVVVPSRDLYDHLTDRIGNINELSGYLPMWQAIGRTLDSGLLAIAVVEHDGLTNEGDYLPSGNDGRAAQGRARRI